MDLFEHEQQIYDNALTRIIEVTRMNKSFDFEEYAAIAKEYGKLLKQLRRATRIADRTTLDLHESNLDLTDKVHYDVLTGIYNRRYMEDNLNRVIKSMSRSGGFLSVMMLDIDHFKKYNDTHGHNAGDACLKAVAEAIAGSLSRADDFAARYGGEEFAVILPGTDESGARTMANKILENVQSKCNSTVSIGVTTCAAEHTQSGIDYIKRADEALYMSKQNGRNQYTFLNFKEEQK